MRQILTAVFLAGICAQAQNPKDLLLPEPRHMAGTVVDPNGNPVARASFDYSGDSQTNNTESDGRFVLDTKSPSVVLRKDGFQSQWMKTQNATDLRIVLQPNEIREFPICLHTEQTVGLEGWGALFRFPRVSGVTVSPQGQDADYGQRFYYVDTAKGRPPGIQHASGGLWGPGLPLEDDAWKSVKYEEEIFYIGKVPITDARGQTADGKRWRILGRFGETAAYRDVDEPTAAILDQMLDRACLGPATSN